MSEAKLKKLMAELPPPTWQEIQELRKLLRVQTRRDAITQMARAMPEDLASPDTDPSYQAGTLLATFLPNDGLESTLSRLMITATNAAMDCFARANSEASEVRDLELNYAVKLSLVAATLGKALDHHRASKKDDFIDDTLPIERCRKSPVRKPSVPPEGQSSTKEKA
jgi:hypothetical protein